MAASPQTWAMLQAVQYRVWSEVLVAAASPFTPFTTGANPENPAAVSDLTRFGTNPQGSVLNAVYINMPKVYNAGYPRQCHIAPLPELVYRRALGGKVWHETICHVRMAFNATTDRYQALQDLVNAADAAHVVMNKHAELPQVATVQAVREEAQSHGIPNGYWDESILGEDWLCWGGL